MYLSSASLEHDDVALLDVISVVGMCVLMLLLFLHYLFPCVSSSDVQLLPLRFSALLPLSSIRV